MKQKLLAMLITLCLVAGMIPAAASEQAAPEPAFSDIAGHWAEEAIELWASRGILLGYNGRFRPDDAITQAELAVLVDRLADLRPAYDFTNIFERFDKNAWYADSLRKMGNIGLIQGGKPFDAVNREKAVSVLSAALEYIEYVDGKNEAPFTDEAAISRDRRGTLRDVKASGYVQADENGRFRPKEPMTRAEFVAILTNMMRDAIWGPGIVNGTAGTAGPKDVAVYASGVTLKNYTVAGDLCIMSRVTGGTVVLDNVTVGGELIVNGATHVVLKNGCTAENISTRREGGATISLSVDTKVRHVQISSGNSLTHGDVSILDTDTPLTVSGNFDTLVVTGWDTTLTCGGVTYRLTGDEAGPLPITLARDCTVKEMVLQCIIQVLGEGTVEHCLLQSVRAVIADTVKLDPANITVDIIDDGTSGPT